jgi:hypothetical protein
MPSDAPCSRSSASRVAVIRGTIGADPRTAWRRVRTGLVPLPAGLKPRTRPSSTVPTGRAGRIDWRRSRHVPTKEMTRAVMGTTLGGLSARSTGQPRKLLAAAVHVDSRRRSPPGQQPFGGQRFSPPYGCCNAGSRFRHSHLPGKCAGIKMVTHPAPTGDRLRVAARSARSAAEPEEPGRLVQATSAVEPRRAGFVPDRTCRGPRLNDPGPVGHDTHPIL